MLYGWASREEVIWSFSVGVAKDTMRVDDLEDFVETFSSGQPTMKTFSEKKLYLGWNLDILDEFPRELGANCG